MFLTTGADSCLSRLLVLTLLTVGICSAVCPMTAAKDHALKAPGSEARLSLIFSLDYDAAVFSDLAWARGFGNE